MPGRLRRVLHLAIDFIAPSPNAQWQTGQSSLRTFDER
jgi:hypothetical protein